MSIEVRKRINYYCPKCESEDHLERCFAASKELWGWSSHCKACDWRGQAPYWVDHFAPSRFDDEPREREPFTDWPNNQGTYD